jgi:hypothetical protein
MAGKPWSDERKAAHSARLRARWKDPEYRAGASRRSGPLSPEAKAAASERMRKLNERMKTDAELKRRNVEGQTAARQDPEYREIRAILMTETMLRPEVREKSRQHCVEINRDPEVRERQVRGWKKNRANRGDNDHA